MNLNPVKQFLKECSKLDRIVNFFLPFFVSFFFFFLLFIYFKKKSLIR